MKDKILNDLLDVETQAILLSKSIPHQGFRSSLMAYIGIVNCRLNIDQFLGASPIFSNFSTSKIDGKIVFEVNTSEFGIKRFTYDTVSNEFEDKVLIKELANYGLKYSF